MYDYIVIGGGVAGCSIAYFLSLEGKKVAIVEQNNICSGASFAAGAFINPVMGRPSRFKKFSDDAFAFSIDYFSSYFSDIFNQCGTYLLPKVEKSVEEFLETGKYNGFDSLYISSEELDFLKPYTARYGAYFCKSAGVISPKIFCTKITQLCDIYEHTTVDVINVLPDGSCDVSGVRGERVILSTGANVSLLGEEYLKKSIVGLWGQKIELRGDFDLKSNISGEVLISTATDGAFAVGATYIRAQEPLAITKEATDELVCEASKIVDMKNVDFKCAKGGLRSTSIDHFPIVGRVINSISMLSKFPQLEHGRKLKPDQIEYLPNLYIFSGHTSKAFSVAFMCGYLFKEYLCGKSPLPDTIDSDRLFFRWCRKRAHK